MNTFKRSNFGQFLGTRKFWSPVIAFVNTIVIYAAPELLGVEIDPNAQLVITGALWALSGLIVHGDIRYDWLAIQTPPPPAPVAAG